MSEQERIIEQDDAIQESSDQAIREVKGASLQGVEGGFRLDVFDHDDPEDAQCLCDLPELQQDIILSEIEADA